MNLSNLSKHLDRLCIRRFEPREVIVQRCEPTVKEDCQSKPKMECSEKCVEKCEDEDKRVCMTMPVEECKEVEEPVCESVPREKCGLVPKRAVSGGCRPR